ncbi:MAG: helix-turn-helix transcriptional regulator [Thermoleophilia bacterium]|nr:helix-turn-helix transcriptional regulator [Thermoleophilia bacterium]
MHAFAHGEHRPPEPDLARRLGLILRARREEAGLSLRAAAERAGMSAAHLSEVERGIKEPSLARLGPMARALGLAPGEVVLDLAIALGAAPPRPVRHPAGFAPDPRDELAWAADRLHENDLRAVAAFGAFLASRPDGGPRP